MIMQATFPRPAVLAMAAAFALTAATPPANAQFWRRKAKTETVIGAAVSSVAGDVQRQAKGAASWAPASAQEALDSGDRVKTGADGSAVVAFTDGSVIEVGANSNFLFEDHSAKAVKLNISVGLLKAWIKKASRRYTVRTPTSVAAIRGTEFLTNVDASGETTWDLFSGSIDVSDNFGNSQALAPGNRIVASKTAGLSEAKPIPPAVKMAPKPAASAPKPKQAAKPAPVEEKAPPPEDAAAEETQEEAPPAEEPPPAATESPTQNIQIAPPSEISPSSP